jgi:hypothetical protein
LRESLGYLKKAYFFKNCNRMRKQKDINNSFVTCCIIHNLLLQEDGYLDNDLPHLPNGVKDTLGRLFSANAPIDPRGKALTFGVAHDTEDDLYDEEKRQQCPVESKRLANRWQKVMQVRVHHYDFHENRAQKRKAGLISEA